jgi:hypothetical protein
MDIYQIILIGVQGVPGCTDSTETRCLGMLFECEVEGVPGPG